MSNNRYAVTSRFNLQEQGNLRSLCEFYSLDEKAVLKLAFEQLAQATNNLQNKLKNEGRLHEEVTQPTATDSAGGVADTSSAGVDQAGKDAGDGNAPGQATA